MRLRRTAGRHEPSTTGGRRGLVGSILVVVFVLAGLGAGIATLTSGGGERDGQRDVTSDSGVEAEDMSDDGDRNSHAATQDPPPPREGPQGAIPGTIGETVEVGGFAVIVDRVDVEADERSDALLVWVTLTNRADEPQAYGYAAFSLESSGRLTFALPSRRPDALRMGTLPPGEAVSGVVTFDAGAGNHTVIFDPGDRQASVARWEITA